jgi:hypothetical protein
MLSKQASVASSDLIPVRPLPPVAKEDSRQTQVALARGWSQRKISQHVACPDAHAQDELRIVASGEALLSDAEGGAGATKQLSHLWTVETAHIR